MSLTARRTPALCALSCCSTRSAAITSASSRYGRVRMPSKRTPPPPTPNNFERNCTPCLAARSTSDCIVRCRSTGIPACVALFGNALRPDGFRYRRPVRSRVRRGVINTGLRIVQNRLPPPHLLRVLPPDCNLMPALGELLQSRGRHAHFNGDVAAGRVSLREARRLHGGLNVHPVIGDVGGKLCVRQRLVRPAHNAETDVQIAALHEGRNDGVEWPLPGSEDVGMLGLQG